MDKLITQYNIYCDESRVENKDSKKMVIGALFLPRRQKKRITESLKKIFRKFNFTQELKWSRINKEQKNFYKSIIDFFISEKNLNFRCIIVDKSKIKYDLYHNNDEELAFFKFYYLMLRPKLLDYNQYFIFLDRKPTRDKNRARALHSFLESYILLNRVNCSIKHLQAYSSKENILIQLCDFLTGLMGFASNYKNKESLKLFLTLYLRKKLGRIILCKTTTLNEEKFNILKWITTKV
jgi:hypothetical protein